jgi:cysteine-rich CPXCG protein
MQNELKSEHVSCPYCGEMIEILVDCSEPSQGYIEDCQVCCRPINVQANVSVEGEVDVTVSHENE